MAITIRPELLDQEPVKRVNTALIEAPDRTMRSCTTAQIVVKDAVKTAEHYQSILGFELISYFPDKISCAYVILQRNGFPIHLEAVTATRCIITATCGRAHPTS